ncbi:hypothetical protein THAOC_36152, partial [Thalassiosira oceanica]
MHAAMGVGEEERGRSPQDTVLSKVTTAARPSRSRASPGGRGADAAARHAARDRAADDQLARLGGGEASPPEPVDPPEEAGPGRAAGGGGWDPDEEREEAADPEGEEVVARGAGREPRGARGQGQLQPALRRRPRRRRRGDGAMKFAAPEVDEEVDFGDGGGDGFGDDDDAGTPRG